MRSAPFGYPGDMSATATRVVRQRGRNSGCRRVLPLWVILGGPQADSLRRLLTADLRAPYIAVSASSVDDMTLADVPGMLRLLNHADALITEHLPSGYRGLPVGLGDLLPHLRPGIPVVTFPRISYAGLHPFHVGRDPVAGLSDPPMVPYHDLRSVAVAAGRMSPESARDLVPPAQVIREFAAWQLLRMRRNEALTDCSIASSVRGAGLGAVHTVDRPGNLLLLRIAQDIQRALDVDITAVDPGTLLLGQCRGPVEPQVAEALGVEAPTSDRWSVNGRNLTIRRVQRAHVRWYHRHPDVLKAVLAAEAPRMEMLGLL